MNRQPCRSAAELAARYLIGQPHNLRLKPMVGPGWSDQAQNFVENADEKPLTMRQRLDKKAQEQQ